MRFGKHKAFAEEKGFDQLEVFNEEKDILQTSF